jgi:hypothetical protein
MKSFKQFIFEGTKPIDTQYEVISNSHGAHALKDAFSKSNTTDKQNPYYKSAKEYEVISNSHGAHANLPTKLKENTENTELPSFEKNFLPDIKTADDRMEFNKGIDAHIDKLHKAHAHSKEGKSHQNKFTEGSSGVTADLIKHHTENKPLEHKEFIENLDKHAFVPAKHDFSTYSGVGFNIKNVKPVGKSKEGNPVHHATTFMSSSIDPHVSTSFGQTAARRNETNDVHILHWHHKKGDPIGVVGKHSEFPAENEVLVPRTESTPEKYHIEHISTDKYRDQYGHNVHVHHVKRIPESEIIKKSTN